MGKNKPSIMKAVKIFFGFIFAISCLFPVSTPQVYADPVDEPTHIQETTTSETDQKSETESNSEQQPEAASEETKTCQESLQSIGWLVCPTTGVIAKAVDWLYGAIEDILVINPISMDDGSPIYEIWKYCRGITNIVFCIFLLVVIFSQLTGFGINNYGIKKALPKLIVAAILVNLSFIICSICVDVSNVVGMSLRGVFSAVEEAALANTDFSELSTISFASLDAVLAGGAALTIAGIVFSGGSIIWLFIPVVLGAVVAVASGLITIALRQAVITLLIMISPLAFVALVLPNTEQLFKKWKDLIYKMLIFYPSFSFLFGASNLAGWAIIMSAKNALAVLLGLAVQVFPLFFSWKLMRMSGTFLEGINGAIRGLASKPLAANKAWANSRRELSRQKFLANSNMPSARLGRFLENRRISRELETAEYANLNKGRGTAYHAISHYNRKGQISKKGKRAYELQARNMRHQQLVAMDQNNQNRGLSDLPSGYSAYIAAQRKDFLKDKNSFSNRIAGVNYQKQLVGLDMKNVDAAYNLKAELTRGAKIEYDNAKGLYARTDEAINAHIDAQNVNNPNYQLHAIEDRAGAERRYNSILNIMEGNAEDVHFVGADNAYSFNSHAQIVQGKFQRYFSLGLPSADIVRRMQEFTLRNDVKDNMDVIIPGLRILNQYGDTDVVRDRFYEILEAPDGTKKIDLGTYASQSLASFCMFDVKDSDPFLRRFGKYINVETARIYNEGEPQKRRRNTKITFDEYINGEYEEYDVDDNGNLLTTTHMAKPKYDAEYLLQGTSFKGMERTAIPSMIESIRRASYETNENGEKVFNMEKFKKTQEKIWNSIMPNIIGDQFSFLSGSEQIKALAKGITGMDGDAFDWKGIFGDELAATLTDEQKKDYIESVLMKRTNTFLNGHVPNQIARTKSDMLGSVMSFFTMSSAVENGDNSVLHKTKKDIEAENRQAEEAFKEAYKAEHGGAEPDKDTISKNVSSYNKRYEAQYGLQADDKLIKSLKPETLQGFLKMYHKGYQGDTKANLTQHLHAEELYKKYFGNSDQTNKRRRQHVEDDDEDGLVVTDDTFEPGDGIDSAIHQSEIEKIYMSDQTGSTNDFYVEATNYLNSVHLDDVARELDNYYQNNSTVSRADVFKYLKDLI